MLSKRLSGPASRFGVLGSFALGVLNREQQHMGTEHMGTDLLFARGTLFR
jgi:hypothetical protein